MVTPADIVELKSRLKDLIPEGIGISLQELKHVLPAYNHKHNDLIQLEHRLNEANRRSRNGMISYEVLQREYANITDALMKLIDTIDIKDFEDVQQKEQTRKKRQGSILHRIPDQMELHRESRCIVRLAFQEKLLLEDMELDSETHIESIRIAEVMGVELIDPNENHAFSIRTFNQAEQFLDEDDYCEWIFYVKPLLEGTYPLLLKVSVLEEIRGKERVREIVMEENIQILTKAPLQDNAFKKSDYQFSTALSIERGAIEIDSFQETVPPPSPTPPPIARKRKFNYAPLLALLLIGSIGIYISTSTFSHKTIEINNSNETVKPPTVDTLDTIE